MYYARLLTTTRLQYRCCNPTIFRKRVSRAYALTESRESKLAHYAKEVKSLMVQKKENRGTGSSVNHERE